MLYPDSRILVFCKAPVAGKVKTRLAEKIGEDAAATIHEYLAWHCLKNIINEDIAPVELWCAPDTRHEFFHRCETIFGVTLKQQKGKCLGERMENAFVDALSQTQTSLVIGTDCPAITPSYLRAAFLALEKHNTVLGPAEDGGYVLLGLRQLQTSIFSGMPWGSSRVLDETISRLKGDVHQLGTLWDVDRVEDLARLRNACHEFQFEKGFTTFLDECDA